MIKCAFLLNLIYRMWEPIYFSSKMLFSDWFNNKMHCCFKCWWFFFSFEYVSLDALKTSKPTSSGSVAVTVGGTVGSFVIVVIGVILAFFALRYA